MGSRIQCFLVEETGMVEIHLRRYHGFNKDEPKCSGKMGYHNTSIKIAEQEAKKTSEGYLDIISEISHDDSRWPVRCECGYIFTDDDGWQTNQHLILQVANNSKAFAPQPGRWIRQDLPPGAMFYASYKKGWPFYHPGPDGKVLEVITPAGEWIIDSEASNGEKGKAGWTREGVPPLVTAKPSIGIGGTPFKYHGFLTNGWLEEC